MIGCRQYEDVGAEAQHHALEAVEGLEVGDGRGRQRPYGSLEEVRVGPVQPDLLRARHRVATDEARVVGRLDDGGLDPAHVAHHRIRPARRRRKDPAHLAGHGGGGHGNEDHLGVQVVTDGVDHTGRQRFGRPRLVGIDARDVPAPATQPEGDGAPDEPRPDDQRRGDPARPQSGRSSRSPWAPWR